MDLSYNRAEPCCVKCNLTEEEKDEELHRSASKNCGINLLEWSKNAKDWAVHGRLNTCIDPEDTNAADIYYHISCYMKLKTAARSMERAQKRTQDDITLLSFCAAQLMKTPLAADVVLYNTIGERVLCSNLDADLDLMQSCNHEEADTRSFLHLKYCNLKDTRKLSSEPMIQIGL